jgi:hypothetical protein
MTKLHLFQFQERRCINRTVQRGRLDQHVVRRSIRITFRNQWGYRSGRRQRAEQWPQLFSFNWEDNKEWSGSGSSSSTGKTTTNGASAPSIGKTTTAIGLSSVALELERGGWVGAGALLGSCACVEKEAGRSFSLRKIWGVSAWVRRLDQACPVAMNHPEASRPCFRGRDTDGFDASPLPFPMHVRAHGCRCLLEQFWIQRFAIFWYFFSVSCI